MLVSHRTIKFGTGTEKLAGSDKSIIVLLPRLEELSIHLRGSLPVDPLHFSLGQEPGLQRDVCGLFVHLQQEEVEWYRATAVHTAVQAVMPSLEVIVGAHRQHVHTPIPHTEGRVSKPLAPNVVHKLVEFVCLDTLVEVVVRPFNVFRWEEWQCHD